MNIDIVIEKLTTYAEIHLMAEPADKNYIRNRLTDLLGVTDFKSRAVDEDEIYDMENCEALVREALDFALKNGSASELDRKRFLFELYDIISLSPSAINDVFFDLYDLKPEKAFEWFYDYSVKVGAIKKTNCKIIKANATTDMVSVPRIEEAASAVLRFTDVNKYSFRYVPVAVLPQHAYFEAYNVADLMESAYRCADFTGKTVLFTFASPVFETFDYEFPAMRAKASGKIVIGEHALDAEILQSRGETIKLKGSREEISMFVSKLLAVKNEDVDCAVIIDDKNQTAFVKFFKGDKYEALGLHIIEPEMDKTLKLCAKYLTGAAVYSAGTLSAEFKPYEQLIDYVVSGGKVAEGNGVKEVLARVAEFLSKDKDTVDHTAEVLSALAEKAQ